MTDHNIYMQRALQLAAKGFPHAFPNPMVGAVVTDAAGNIIGEGYHRRCGEAHAEVNAIKSVADPAMLKEATIYVTLEPCAHYGRTPPCSRLIIESGIPNVVVGTRDPFDKVDGKGIEMLHAAGVNVTVGVMQEQCQRLNAVFFTAHSQKRPFVYLKWAQTADGYTDTIRLDGMPQYRISDDVDMLLVHRIRSWCDGILVGSGTVLSDNPMLTNRLWPGKSPRPIILDRRQRVGHDRRILSRDPIIIHEDLPIHDILHNLYVEGFNSILVEGGPTVLQAFIDSGIWDIARVETSPDIIGDKGMAPAPQIHGFVSCKSQSVTNHNVNFFIKNPLIEVKIL